MWERPWTPHTKIATYVFTPHKGSGAPQTTIHTRFCAGAEHLSRHLGDDKWVADPLKGQQTCSCISELWMEPRPPFTQEDSISYTLAFNIFDVKWTWHVKMMSDLQAEEVWLTHQRCRRMLNMCNYCLWVVYMPQGRNISISEWHSSRPLTSQGSQVEKIEQTNPPHSSDARCSPKTAGRGDSIQSDISLCFFHFNFSCY